MSPAGPPSARNVLLELSGAALRESDRERAGAPASRGAVAYVRLATWQLSDQAVGGRRVARPLTRTVTAWRREDGAGRTVTMQRTRTGAIRTVSATLPAGDRLPVLTGSGATLGQRLDLPSGASTAQAIATFTGLAAREPIPAATQAQILARLAGDAGLVDAGHTRDRAGRSGLVISFTGPQRGAEVRETLVLDPRTGALLEFDRTLAGPPGRLNVASGGLLSYAVFLRAGRVARLGETPTPAPR